MPRASGKTTLLIKESAKTGRPIIEPNTASARYVEEQAREMGVKIPEPISATSWHSGYYRGSNFSRIDGFLIDEVDSVLANIFGKPIVKATYTPEKTELDSVLEKFHRLDRNPSEPIVFATSAKEDKSNMSKFKVGDIVRVKSVNEMKKSPVYGVLLNAYENTQHTIVGLNTSGYYILDGCEGLGFDNYMLEHCRLENDGITGINVIVPDKVVEIEFCDGKEKMICHKEDIFDLRKCCFIAISKHLYKKEYTYEGIEHMADQLMYQKKYVKAVDKALKDYYKKEAEKERMRKEEEENKIVRERQALRKKKYKKRREQRYRDEMVNLIATAIKTSKFFD